MTKPILPSCKGLRGGSQETAIVLYKAFCPSPVTLRTCRVPQPVWGIPSLQYQKQEGTPLAASSYQDSPGRAECKHTVGFTKNLHLTPKKKRSAGGWLLLSNRKPGSQCSDCCETVRARDERLQHPQPMLPHAKPPIASVGQGRLESPGSRNENGSFKQSSLYTLDTTTTVWDTQG